MTTQFSQDGALDIDATQKSIDALVRDGVDGVVLLGTCGENNSLQPAEKRLVLALNRFDWEACGEVTPCYQRRRTALRFERVLSFRCRNVNPAAKDAVRNLLAVEFAETDSPAGVVTLIFSGGAALRLEVECLECELADLGPAWTAAARPAHTIDHA